MADERPRRNANTRSPARPPQEAAFLLMGVIWGAVGLVNLRIDPAAATNPKSSRLDHRARIAAGCRESDFKPRLGLPQAAA